MKVARETGSKSNQEIESALESRALSHTAVAIRENSPDTIIGLQSYCSPTLNQPMDEQKNYAHAVAPTSSAKSSLLIKLSESCKNHRAQHHSQARSADYSPQIPSTIPPECVNALSILEKTIPKLERSHRDQCFVCTESDSGDSLSRPTLQSSSSQITLENIAHICDFYMDVMKGGFCPHAPHLLQLGKGAEHVLPRVHFLLEHVVTRAVISNTVKTAMLTNSQHKHVTDAFGQKDDLVFDVKSFAPSIVEKVTDCIVHLLSTVPERHLQDCIIRDLINLAMDCSILLETSLQRNDEFLLTNVEIVLFSETTDVAAETAIGLPEYGLQLSLKEHALSLQATTLGVLERLLPILRQKRLKPFEDEDDNSNISSLFISDVVSMFPCLGLNLEAGDICYANDDETWDILLTTLHQVLCKLHFSASFVSSGKTAMTLQTLVICSRNSALNLICIIQQDLDKSGSSFPCKVQRISELVTRAVGSTFHYQWLDEAIKDYDERKIYVLILAYLQKLALLLRNVILRSSSMQGSRFRHAIQSSIQCLSFPTLLDSLVNASTNQHKKESNILILASGYRRILEPALLRCILETLQNAPDSQTLIDEIKTRPLVLTYLLDSLDTRELSSTASSVLFFVISNSCNSFVISDQNIWDDVALSYNVLQTSNESVEQQPHLVSTKRVANEDLFETQQVKRRKTVEGRIETDQFFYVDTISHHIVIDRIASFFWRAWILSRTKRNDAGGESEECFAKLLAQSNVILTALQLLLPVLSFHKKSKNFLFLSLYALDFMFTTSNYIISRAPLRENVSQILKLAANQIEFGVFVYFLQKKVTFKQHDLSSRLHDFVNKAVEIYLVFFACDELNDVLSRSLAEFPFLNGCSTQVLPGILLSVGMNNSISCAKVILMPEILNLSPKGQMKFQNIRTKLLTRRINVDNRAPIMRECISEQDTLKLIESISKDHEDPIVRLLCWQSIAWFLLSTSPLRLQLTGLKIDFSADKFGDSVSHNLVCWLIKCAFVDSAKGIRDYAGRELGKLFLENNGLTFLLLTSTDEEWSFYIQSRPVADRVRRRKAFETAGSRIMQVVEYVAISSFNQSQLYGASTQFPTQIGTQEVLNEQLTLDICVSLVRTLLSLCGNSPSKNDYENVLFEKAINLVLNLFGESIVDVGGPVLGEFLLRDNRKDNAGSLLKQYSSKTLIKTLFWNMIFPSSRLERTQTDYENVSTHLCERQYRFLRDLLHEYFLDRSDLIRVSSSLEHVQVEIFVRDLLPTIVSQLIVDENYDALKRFACFKFFLEKLIAQDQSNTKKRGQFFDRIVESLRLRKRKRSKREIKLEDQISNICLAPAFIELILPPIMKKSGNSALLFFLQTVLRNKLSLTKIITLNERRILKSLIIDLGRGLEMRDHNLMAIKKAAVARQGQDDALSCDNLDERDLATAAEWVSSHFLFLLVNVVQKEWNSRTYVERLDALQALHAILHFGLLLSERCSQYITQVLQIISSAFNDDTGDSDLDLIHRSKLILCASETLFLFVKLMATHRVENLGQNLSSIVVTLIPFLLSESVDCTSRTGVSGIQFLTEAKETAIALFNWLVEGEVGKQLASFFSDIPFIPVIKDLDNVRLQLRRLGVDFDNLDAMSIDGTEEENVRSSFTSDGASIASERFSSPHKQAALRKRLEMISTLLSNENLSVRDAILKHLTALLRANRGLFHDVVENERTASFERYITKPFASGLGESRGSISKMMEVLLSRCIYESDHSVRILLATCLGEVGGIDSYYLEEARASMPTKHINENWRIQNPPWRSDVFKYGLQLVTHHLVAALKSALTSREQNMVAFSVQQLLVLLNQKENPIKVDCKDDPCGSNLSDNKPTMSHWLSSKLSEEGVIDIVSPFWYSEFAEISFVAKLPPFFDHSQDYFTWLSTVCRYSIHRVSTCATKSPWSRLLISCRTAVRTRAGLSVAEFLLPILVLDRLCFGDSLDEQVLLDEFSKALTFDLNSSRSQMNQIEKQKAVNAIFEVIDTLQLWLEEEVEKKYSSGNRHSDNEVGSCTCNPWSVDESLMRISNFLNKMPLFQQALAAESVGMHARSLRTLEYLSRQSVSESVFSESEKEESFWKKTRSRASGCCPASDVSLMKKTLAALNDFETMACLSDDEIQTDPLTSAIDSIRQREASNDWEGAMQDYERAQQLAGKRQPMLQRGALRCLLELGSFENVLNQVSGMFAPQHKESLDLALPVAIEAAWRLGRWETLSDLVSVVDTAEDCETSFQIALGKTFLGLRQNDVSFASSELRKARVAVMADLSSYARESYSRAYSHLVRLQSLREIEDSLLLKSSGEKCFLSDYVGNLRWDRRLDFVSSGEASNIIKVRVALSRLTGDHSLEGVLFFKSGKRARKLGMYSIAANCFAQAEAAFLSISRSKYATHDVTSLNIQKAKLKHDCGNSSAALRMLGLENVDTSISFVEGKLSSDSVHYIQAVLGLTNKSSADNITNNLFAKRVLQSTRWMIEGGLKSGVEVVRRFRTIHKLAPAWEKGYFQYAKFVESMLEARCLSLHRRSTHDDLVESEDLAQRYITDESCQRYISQAMESYVAALSLDTKHVYQALPRLLSLWFDLTSSASQPVLSEAQGWANEFMAESFRKIPAQCFFTAIPQIVSSLVHKDKDTANVVKGILKRLLAKFPAQTMWPLAWLRQSQHSERKKAGESIFRDAERTLANASPSRHNLLVASKSLFSYLQDLAKYEVKSQSISSINIKPWHGEVELMEFIPPIQAALQISLSINKHEMFPRHIFRMRTFKRSAFVLSSKARPKKLIAFIVSANFDTRFKSDRAKNGDRDPKDIGELHFLVKQEAKGDLRKDGRVQDLNNVINRLMSSDESSKKTQRNVRRLHVRTFAVTCLSEETGILEWVPQTVSLRSLISKCYNPLAPINSCRRRGQRITNFSDASLRSNFEEIVQDAFFTKGDLNRATVLFEQLCLQPYPPLFYWWFVHAFRDPASWYEARTSFTMSTAAWSAVGHVIGLGDRHSENILVDTSSGACVHVDFDCIFDKGLHLPKPEVVPFRLTQNMLDAFGPTGADGLFFRGLLSAMKVLRENRDTLLSVLEPFVKDPVIDWKRKKASHNSKVARDQKDKQLENAKKSIYTIDERLKGIYNLRNPNLRKNLRKENGATNFEDDDDSLTIALSVEGQVQKMIAEATSNQNLLQLYVGWMPWI